MHESVPTSTTNTTNTTYTTNTTNYFYYYYNNTNRFISIDIIPRALNGERS